jgi:hypothetical protein
MLRTDTPKQCINKNARVLHLRYLNNALINIIMKVKYYVSTR